MQASHKPDKPCPDFPLFSRDSGQAAKKVRGRLRYFGLGGAPDAAI
jgi:hypothetical protein